MRERVFITGAGGFVGGHLRDALRESRREVLGVGKNGDGETRSIDIRDEDALTSVMREFAPDAVVHLAASTYVPAVRKDPDAAHAVNVGGTEAALRATSTAAPEARFLLVSSCMVYGSGLTPSDPAWTEDAPLLGEQPYARQKIEAERVGERFRADGLDVVIVRPFNHIGPGMRTDLSVMRFACAIARAERGEGPAVLEVGNLDPRRDFLHVSDVVRAYHLLLDHDAPPTPVNVSSGHSVKVRDMLELLLESTETPIEVRENADGLVRKDDVLDSRGDASLLKRTTGWRPTTDLRATVKEILECARNLG